MALQLPHVWYRDMGARKHFLTEGGGGANPKMDPHENKKQPPTW